MIKHWGYLVRRDNRHETMYSRQPFIDGQGVQRVVVHDEPWPDDVQVIDGIVRTMPRYLSGPVWMKFVWMQKDKQSARDINQSLGEFRNRVDRAVWYVVGRIDG